MPFLVYGKMSVARIDEAILSTVGERWTKVAMVVATVAKSADGDLPSTDDGHQVIFDRIEALVRSGRLWSKGDIRVWRFSEIRRADGDRESKQEPVKIDQHA